MCELVLECDYFQVNHVNKTTVLTEFMVLLIKLFTELKSDAAEIHCASWHFNIVSDINVDYSPVTH